MELTDTQARIVSLLHYGLEYFEIVCFLGITPQSVWNNISCICNGLELHGAFHLISTAADEGFDKAGCCPQGRVLTIEELIRLHKRFPLSRKNRNTRTLQKK